MSLLPPQPSLLISHLHSLGDHHGLQPMPGWSLPPPPGLLSPFIPLLPLLLETFLTGSLENAPTAAFILRHFSRPSPLTTSCHPCLQSVECRFLSSLPFSFQRSQISTPCPRKCPGSWSPVVFGLQRTTVPSMPIIIATIY